MQNLNEHTQKRNLKLEPTDKLKNCSHVCAYHCAQLLYRTQHRTVLLQFQQSPKVAKIGIKALKTHSTLK